MWSHVSSWALGKCRWAFLTIFWHLTIQCTGFVAPSPSKDVGEPTVGVKLKSYLNYQFYYKLVRCWVLLVLGGLGPNGPVLALSQRKALGQMAAWLNRKLPAVCSHPDVTQPLLMYISLHSQTWTRYLWLSSELLRSGMHQQSIKLTGFSCCSKKNTHDEPFSWSICSNKDHAGQTNSQISFEVKVTDERMDHWLKGSYGDLWVSSSPIVVHVLREKSRRKLNWK